MFIVARQFVDRLSGHMYNTGDVFPYNNVPVKVERVDELLAGRGGVPFIKVVPEATGRPREDVESVDPGETPVDDSKPKRRPRKRRGE